jgi:hypothetical protein
MFIKDVLILIKELKIKGYIRDSRGLGLWCLVPLSTIFQLLSWQSVLLVEEIGVNDDLRQVTDKLTTDSYFIIIIITLI